MLRNLTLIGLLLLTFFSTSSFGTVENNQPNIFSLDSEQYGMEIYLKDLNSKVITLNVSSNETILNVKLKYQDATGMPPEAQQLIFAGRQLEDDKTLEDYNILKETYIHIVPKMRRE